MGEIVLAALGCVGLAWVIPSLRREWRTYRWARWSAPHHHIIARGRVRKLVGRVVVCIAAIVIGAMAASAPGRWAGSGVGFEVARLMLIAAFAVPVWAQWADDKDHDRLERMKNERLLEVLQGQADVEELRPRGVDQVQG